LFFNNGERVYDRASYQSGLDLSEVLVSIH
jgi:hypothetical protein